MSRQSSDPAEVRGAGPLFEPPVRHLVGRTDPPTSRRAAEAIVGSVKLGEHQRMALQLVRDHPGLTCPELAAIAAPTLPLVLARIGIEGIRQVIGRRLSDLTNPPGPLQVPGKPHLIMRRGTRDGCACWWAVPEPEE